MPAGEMARVQREEGVIPMKKVVVAVDGSDVSKEVIDYALHYAQREKDAELLFLHVVNWEDYREVSVGGRSVSVPPSEEEAGKELGDWVQERVVSSGTPKPERMSINVLFGNPYNEIVSFAEKMDASMIMIGHRGLSNLERFFLGSVAAKVVAHSPCSVYVHREKSIPG
ncbi:MAG: universal stress protein [Thermovirgaceae bacterium]|jgi:nucleotide-binding universal stress UspA family protein|nr:universal stress protein [Synergistales bacterium]NMD16958.1 universal stress protein [Synergistaceae bacterium]